MVGGFCGVELDEAGLEGLAEEGAAGGCGPGYEGVEEGDLEVGAGGDGLQVVEKVADYGGYRED